MKQYTPNFDIKEELWKSYEREQERRNDPDVPQCDGCGDSGHMVWNEKYEEFRCIHGECITERIRETVQKIVALQQ